MAFNRSLAIFGLALALLVTYSWTFVNSESPDVCYEEFRDNVTAKQVDDLYNETLVDTEDIRELFESSRSKYHSQLQEAGNDEQKIREVVLEHFDRVCGAIVALEEVSDTLIRLLG